MPFRGEPVEIPAAHATVRGYEFRPRGDAAEVAGLVLALPGSGGGLGPGLSDAPQPFAAAPCRVGHGALYIRLGHELAASGARFTWDYKKSTDKPPARALRGGGADGGGADDAARWPLPRRAGVVTLMIDWSTIPRKRLRRVEMLEAAAADALAGARWLLERYDDPSLPLVVMGFSFGGPAMWAALRALLARRPDGARLAGAASIAGSARGGARFEERLLDTCGAIDAFCGDDGADGGADGAESDDDRADDRAAAAGAAAAGSRPVLFLHGTHDKNVALQVSEYLRDRARDASRRARGDDRTALVRVNHARHMLDGARDAAFEALRSWTLAALAAHDRRARAAPPLPAMVCSIGRSLPSIGRDGREDWRQQPSRRRLARAAVAPGHPLAGLVGYSE